MRTKAKNISVSVTVLLVTLAAAWLLESTIVITEPPGPGPWDSYPAKVISLVLLPLVPWFAARFWYWSPIFFAFGAVLVLPTAWFIFGSRMFRYDPPHPVLTVVVLCCTAGLLAAFIGRISCTFFNTRNA